jgi:light-regulated signal transduction histidine kinase (bacteriophytochrome)
MSSEATIQEDAQLTIRLLQAELEATNREVLALTLELDQRVEERTAQLQTARDELQRANSELRRLNLELEGRVAQRTAELQKAHDELELRVQERTRELAVANKELEAFSYSVSHDLRGPLRAIDGFAGLLSSEYSAELPEEARRYIQIISESSIRMSRLIEDLLTFARFSRQPILKRPVQVSGLVNETLEELRRQQGDRPIEIRIGHLPDCEADPSLLKQVLMNLLSNAFKFSQGRNPAIVEIGSRVEGNEIIYFVRDNGAGFDMQYADKLFGVFQRLHRAEEFEGTGVGLSIVQRIIHRHGGRTWAEGAPNQGATFYFSLPK